MRSLILTIFFLCVFCFCKKVSQVDNGEGIAITETYVNESCATYDTIHHLAYGIFVPNCFTPNGDGINDIFRPVFSPNGVSRENYEFKIFNSSNELIFETNNITEGWSGPGFPMRKYKFSIKVFEICRGIYHYYNGSVMLVRAEYY